MTASDSARDADIEKLIDNNQAWAAGMEQQHPGFLSHSATQQAPKYLWVGCADSRVAPDQILGLMPGEILVHRNIANLVRHDDINCQSVLEFAINVVGVEHIIVCGHYGCAGVATAMQADSVGGLVGDWLAPVQQHWLRHQGDIDAAAVPKEYFCELNARQQALSVCQNPSVQAAWQSGQKLLVHAWVYQLASGRVLELGSASNADEQSNFQLPGV